MKEEVGKNFLKRMLYDKSMLIDTHCHIHSKEYNFDIEATLRRAREAGVEKLVVVGCTVEDSVDAALFADKHDMAFASVGVHPHEAENEFGRLAELENIVVSRLKKKPIVAIGEIGLDYWYEHSPRSVQKKALKIQLDIAIKYDLSCVFHVRSDTAGSSDVFDDFFAIIDQYKHLRGVVHSFSDSRVQLERVLSRSLYVGVNGIATFTKDQEQATMFASIPQGSLLLETDAPYLTPVPKRGRINEPAYVRHTLEYLSKIYRTQTSVLGRATSHNAEQLFKI